MHARPLVATAALVLAFSLAAAAPAFAAGPVDDALAAFKAGDFAKAAEIAKGVAGESKDAAKARYVLGEAQLALEQWDEAEATFRKLVEASPKSVPAMTGLARALTGAKKLDEAGKLLTDATTLDNKDVSAWLALCEWAVARGGKPDLEAAVINLNATLKLDPKEPRVNRLLVETLLRLDKVDDASKAASAYARADKDAAMAAFLTGVVLDRKGEAKDAIKAYEKALEKDEKFLDAHRNLAIVLTTSNTNYADRKKVERAHEHAKRYVDLGGKDAKVLELLATIQSFLSGK